MSCPPMESWHALSAALLSPEAAAELRRHAAACAHTSSGRATAHSAGNARQRVYEACLTDGWELQLLHQRVGRGSRRLRIGRIERHVPRDFVPDAGEFVMSNPAEELAFRSADAALARAILSQVNPAGGTGVSQVGGTWERGNGGEAP